jgi:hypothetical protein
LFFFSFFVSRDWLVWVLILHLFQDAGFEILEHEDLALTSDPETPWYSSSLKNINSSCFLVSSVWRHI